MRLQRKQLHYPMENSPMKIYSIAVFFCAMVLVSCGSSRRIATDGNVDKRVTAKQLIKENIKRDAKFNTLQARVKIEIIQDNKEQSHNVTLRMERGKVIWINAFLNLARAKITPEKVQFYDKINNQYFDGDYTLLSDLLGVELNFDQVQSLLIGEPIFNLKDNEYVISNNETSYILAPKSQNTLYELFLLFSPSHFKMDSQQLAQPLKNRFLQLDYTNYQEVSNEVLPQNLKIIAVEDSEELNIKLEYRSVSINEGLRFPFNIPSGFEEITFDDEN